MIRRLQALLVSLSMLFCMASTFASEEGLGSEDYTYVMMNIPYGDFYSSESVDEYYDAVSTATTTKFAGTTGLAKGTYNDGTDICGVVYPVAINTAVYEELKSSTLTENDDYYISEVLDSEPAAYKVVSYADEKYTFSAVTGATGDSSTLSLGEASTSSSYGDYMFELAGVLTADSVTIGETTGITIGGIILTDSDGKTYGMGMLENLWIGTRVTNAEIAISVPEGNGKTNHGGQAFKTFNLNGKTITSVKLITDVGIYTIEGNLTLPEYYSGEEETTAEITDATTLKISVPSAFTNPKVSVYYTSGRTSYYVAQDAEITDGTVALDGVLETETKYTVSISSDNYAPKTLSVTYGTPVSELMTDAQKETLNELIATGSVLVSGDASLTQLAAHIAEAETLLANEEATADEADELIGELEELIGLAPNNVKGITALYDNGAISYTVDYVSTDGNNLYVAIYDGSGTLVYISKESENTFTPSETGTYTIKAMLWNDMQPKCMAVETTVEYTE